MKRKLALLLAGCLAISPVSAGYFSVQTLAAEAEAGSGESSQYPVVITVKDDNDTALTPVGEESETAKYTITAGESRQLTALIGQDTDSPALSTWSSEAPEILEIDDDGVITAQSAGTALIVLNISYDAEEAPLEFKYEIEVSKAAETADDTEKKEAAEAADDAEKKETAETAEAVQAPEANEEKGAQAAPDSEVTAEAETTPDEVIVEPAKETDPAQTAHAEEAAAEAADAQIAHAEEAAAEAADAQIAHAEEAAAEAADAQNSPAGEAVEADEEADTEAAEPADEVIIEPAKETDPAQAALQA